MESVAESVAAEIEENRKEVRQGAWLTTLTLVGLLTAVVLPFFGIAGWPIVVAYVVAYLAGGVPAGWGAIESLFEKKINIDLLMVLAALAAAAVGEPRDGAILLFLFSLAGTLEGYAMGNTKRAVAALMQLRPDEANVVLPDGSTKRVRVEALELGQRVIVRPGERLPVDGVIVDGQGAIDQSSVTGESVPVDKALGDEVFGGTVNQNAVLTVEVTKTAEQSTIARMIKLVTEAQEQRSPSQRFSDWFGQRYTIFVLLGSATALGIFLLVGIPQSEAFYKAATLLVVASPCAIVISVPAAVLSAIAASARTGVLFKDGAALESLGSIDTIAFDKTGTLTEGKMRVVGVKSLSDLDEQAVLAIAAAVETDSEHPLAASIRRYATEQGVAVSEATKATAVPGHGMTATVDGVAYWAGNRALLAQKQHALTDELESVLTQFEGSGQTTVILGHDEAVLGVIAIADSLRPTAAATLAQLSAQGVRDLVMLTGDTKIVASAIAKQLQLPEASVFGALLPEQKVEQLNVLKQKGTVAFVGDGVNDAAALATAEVGFAIGVGGSDVAMEAADIALLSDDLSKLAKAHALAQKANRIIKQNLFFAVGIMAVMVIMTLFWHLPLPLGVVGHEGGTLLVVANGLRLLFQKV